MEDRNENSRMDESKIWTYGVLVAAVALVVWIGYSALSLNVALPVANAAAAGVSGVSGSASLQPSSSGSIPNECGDINDPQNIQHLSHHPDRYQECYRFLDPQKFRDAVGRDISEFMG